MKNQKSTKSWPDVIKMKPGEWEEEQRVKVSDPYEREEEVGDMILEGLEAPPDAK